MSKRHQTRAWLAAGAALATVFGVGTAAPALGAAKTPKAAATGSPVVIGNVGTYSGIGSILGWGGGQTAANAFVQWVNANGGLNGHVVQLITADDGGDPGKNLTLTQTMVETQHAIAFMGNIAPLSANGSTSYLEQKGVPVVGGDAINPAWWTSPMLFPQSARPDTLVNAVPRLGRLIGATRYAVLYCGETTLCANTRDSANRAIQASGVQLVYGAQISVVQPNFSAECLQAKNQGAQALIVAADDASLTRMARSCSSLGYQPLLFPWSTAVNDRGATDPAVQGAVAAVGTFPWAASTIAPARAFRAAMNQYAPTTALSSVESAVWTSGLLLKAASANLPATNPGSADILKGLWSIKDNNLGGAAPPLTFVQGHTASPAQCYFWSQIRSGAWTVPAGKTQTCAMVSSNRSPAAPSNPVTYTATVTPPPDGGTVAFADGSAPIAGCATQPVNSTTGQATCAVTYSATGSHSITATYGGDATYSASGPSPALSQAVVPLPTATITSATTLSSGQSISGTAADTGGPGVLGVILYYYSPVTRVTKSLAAQCTGCGAGNSAVTWSYTLSPGTPPVPGQYLIVAQAIDTAWNFGGPSNFQSITVS